MKKENYKCKKNFYLRIPYLSYDFYNDYLLGCDLNNIEKIAKDNYAENILSSSQSLYDALINNKKTKNKELNLYKYLLRGSVRTTPFGLNSSVIQGEFSNKSCYLIKSKNKKIVRVDIEWLCRIIKKIEGELYTNLNVIKSDNNIIIKRNHIIKIVDSCFAKNENFLSKTSQINYTNLVKKIFNICGNEYVSIKNIILCLIDDYPNQEEKVLLFIKELLDNEFLVSDLRINLLTKNPFKDLLYMIKNKNYKTNIINQLYEIDELINYYNTLEIGRGEEIYKSIILKMSNIVKVKNYLHIDMYNDSKINLEDDLKCELEDFANFVMKWTCNETYNKYIIKFKEKYGEQAVKLTDVIDEDSGLGIPEIDGDNTIMYKQNFLTILLDYMLKNPGSSIDLDKINAEINLENSVKYDYPSTLELSFFILNEDNQYKYILSPMMGSGQKWKSYGRFDYLFQTSLIENDNEHNDYIKDVEITFYPKIAHDANVSICNSNKEAFIEFNTRSVDSDIERISLDDIYMFVDKHSKLSFLQKSTNQILSFGTTNKYVSSVFPEILKFLVEASSHQIPSIESFLFFIGRLSKSLSGHTPELRYKNFIIWPEIWRIDKNSIIKNEKFISYDEFNDLINDLTTKRQLPYDIYTGYLDRRLILNLNFDVDKKILYELLKKDNNLLIYKKEFSSSNLLLSNNDNEKFIGEFVFQFESRQLSTELFPHSQSRIPLITNDDLLNNSFMPFDKWVTLHLYLDVQNENLILINQINEMYNYFLSENIISSFFFIRYKDPQNHLRIRFKVCKENKAELLETCTNFINILKKYKIINNITYNVYTPEINRYGGQECIKEAENLFYYDSIQVISFLSSIKNRSIKMNIKEIFLISCYKIIKDMGIKDDEIINYLKRYKLNKEASISSRNLFNDVKEYFYNNLSYDFFKERETINIFNILEITKSANKIYWDKLCLRVKNESEFDKKIIQRYAIISILHMHHNRLIGIDRENEDFLMGILEKLIFSKMQKERHFKER